MSSIEYLSLSKPQRWAYNFVQFFVGIGKWFARFFTNLPYHLLKLGNKFLNPLRVLWDAMLRGDWKTRVNFGVLGFAQFFHHQIARGVLYLFYELAFIIFMILIGGKQIGALGTLGIVRSQTFVDPEYGIEVTEYFDNSFNILLYSIVTIVLILVFIALWYFSIRDAKSLQDNENVGIFTSDKEFAQSLADSNYHHVLLAIPMVGLVLFTVIPTIFMILIGFTNFNSQHSTGVTLFDWVGWQNYSELFSNSGSAGGGNLFLTTFLQVFLWTLIWAVFATFSNYFLGMIAAMVINIKGIKLKKLWRTVLVTTIAVPQFVSLLLISKMLGESGFFNAAMLKWGWISQPVRYLTDGTIAKVVIIVVNMWIGIPYTMLSCTGILMNIPVDLYESARIDGASPFKMYTKITLPYMLFVTGPSLISQFVGNINNFNVIYLLSGGGPLFTFKGQIAPARVTGVGQTDLLITWIYKMTMTNVDKDYGAASVVGVMVFILVAFFSLISYNHSSSVKNEEDFQ